MASVRGLLNIQSLNESTHENEIPAIGAPSVTANAHTTERTKHGQPQTTRTTSPTPSRPHWLTQCAVCQSAVGAAPATTVITLNSPLFAGE